eukprot:UN01076
MNIRGQNNQLGYADVVNVFSTQKLHEFSPVLSAHFNYLYQPAPSTKYDLQVPDYAVLSIDISYIFEQWLPFFNHQNNNPFPQILTNSLKVFDDQDDIQWALGQWVVNVDYFCADGNNRNFNSSLADVETSKISENISVSIRSTELSELAKHYLDECQGSAKYLKLTLNAHISLQHVDELAPYDSTTIWSRLQEAFNPSDVGRDPQLYLLTTFNVYYDTTPTGYNVWIQTSSFLESSVELIFTPTTALFSTSQNIRVLQTEKMVNLATIVESNIAIHLHLTPYHMKYFQSIDKYQTMIECWAYHGTTVHQSVSMAYSTTLMDDNCIYINYNMPEEFVIQQYRRFQIIISVIAHTTNNAAVLKFHTYQFTTDGTTPLVCDECYASPNHENVKCYLMTWVDNMEIVYVKQVGKQHQMICNHV